MNLDKCTVTGRVSRADGTPVANASVTFRLSHRDRDGDVTILPAPVTVETDSDGNISVDLWPNARGLAGTIYTASIAVPGTASRTIYPPIKLVVPDEETASFADIQEGVQPVPVNDAIRQVALARLARAEAEGYRDETKALHDEVMPLAPAVETVSANITAVNMVAARDADIATVAARDADIHVVAGRDADIGKVAAIDDDVSALAPIAADITTAAANIADIQAAPGAAVAASDSADLAAAWAEGHEPGGAGTKSAKEWAGEAGADAVTAAATTLREFGIRIYNASGVPAGAYDADLRVAHHTLQTQFYAEIVGGASGGEVDLNVEVNGVTVYGPVTVAYGTPVANAVSIDVPANAQVKFMVIEVRGTVTELSVKTMGAVAP